MATGYEGAIELSEIFKDLPDGLFWQDFGRANRRSYERASLLSPSQSRQSIPPNRASGGSATRQIKNAVALYVLDSSSQGLLNPTRVDY